METQKLHEILNALLLLSIKNLNTSEDRNTYKLLLEIVFQFNIKVSKHFSRKTINKYIEEQLNNQKIKDQLFDESINDNFFKKFEDQKPFDRFIIAPISGIILEKKDKISIANFEIGRRSQLKKNILLFSEDKNHPHKYYISVKVLKIYDENIAIEKAKNMFLDFIRLISFISGNPEANIKIKTEMPDYELFPNGMFYIETTYYSALTEMNEQIPSMSIENLLYKAIPLDDKHFYNNEDFKKLWILYENYKSEKKISNIELRILNASIAIGESLLNKNNLESTLYASMALERLFTFSHKFISENLSYLFASIISKEEKIFLTTKEFAKKFYKLRSDIVHGKTYENIEDKYLEIIPYIRLIIYELLNNKKYENIKTPKELNNFFKSQNSKI